MERLSAPAGTWGLSRRTDVILELAPCRESRHDMRNRKKKHGNESFLGLALTPKAVRYFEKRPYGPGEHGRTRRRQDSDYAVRLKEKQRLRAQYGIRESQLRRAFEEARRTAGLTGENLVELLEMRLDSLVLRAGFARTI